MSFSCDHYIRPGKLDLLFPISHLLDLVVGRQSLFIILHYSLLAHAIYRYMYTWQIYGATAIKSGCVIAWKVIMTVEVAGLRRSGR